MHRFIRLSTAGVVFAVCGSALAQSCPDLGVPVAGRPNWDERVLQSLTNAARIAPSGYAAAILNTNTIMGGYPATAPLFWNDASASVCRAFVTDVTTNCPANIPTHNNCNGTTPTQRAAAGGLCGFFNDLVAASSNNDPATSFNLLLTETPGPPYPADHTTDLHRAAVLSTTPTTIGTGYAAAASGMLRNFYDIDLQGACTTPPACGPVQSGSHLVQASTLDLFANYYDAANLPPQQARVFIDGVPQTLPLYFGTAARGTYKLTVARTGVCRGYHFEFRDSTGTMCRYPGSGELRTFGDGCSESYQAPRLVINEIDYDQPGSVDSAEFIELKNNSATTVDMSLFSVELWNGANNTIYLNIPLAGTLGAGGYYVIAATGSPVPNVNLHVAATSNFIQNGNPDGLLIRFVPTNEVVDAFCYGGAMPGLVEGTALPASVVDDNVTPNWGLSRVPDGADSNNAAADWQLRAITPGASNTSACGSADFDGDGDLGTDADIEAFFACLGGNCCRTCGSADFNGDGDLGTDADIEAFFRVLAGGNC